jgi:hypothetical protein
VINLGESVLFRQHDLLSALIASIALYASMLTVNTTPQQAPGRHERAPQ